MAKLFYEKKNNNNLADNNQVEELLKLSVFFLHVYYKYIELWKYMTLCLDTHCFIYSNMLGENLLIPLRSSMGESVKMGH